MKIENLRTIAGANFYSFDTVEQDLAKWLKFYLDNGGTLEKLTISSDASITNPCTLFDQIRSCVMEHKFALEKVLPMLRQTRRTP